MDGVVTVDEIARRLNVSRATAWRWSRRFRFGEPISRLEKRWRWYDDEILALLLQSIQPSKPKSVWGTRDARGYHKRRLAAVISGELPTDAEDLEMAGVLLTLAARQFERRARGLLSPAAIAAEAVGRLCLSKHRAKETSMPEKLRDTAAELFAMAAEKAGNANTAGKE